MDTPLLDAEKAVKEFDWTTYTSPYLCPESDFNVLLKKIDDLGEEDDFYDNQSQNSDEDSSGGDDEEISEQEDSSNEVSAQSDDSDVAFGYGDGDQAAEQPNFEEEPSLKDRIMECMQKGMQKLEANEMEESEQFVKVAFNLMDYHTPSCWPTQYPEFFVDFGRWTMENSNQPTVAFTYFCVALNAANSSEAEKCYEGILEKVDEIDNYQLQEIYELRRVLSDSVRQEGFNWAHAIVNAYPEHIYNTCAIEGNRLGLEEVTQLMKTGIQSTQAGQIIGNHDKTEIVGAYNAYAYLFNEMGGKQLTVERILAMHKLILENMPKGGFAGVFKDTMRISSADYESMMKEFVDWFQQVDENAVDAISLAAMTHFVLVAMHPFVDGNGRCARLLMNFVLMSHGFPPVVITMAKREAYYTALEIGHKGDLRPFIRFIGESTIDTMRNMVDNGLSQIDEVVKKGSVAGSSGSEIQKPRWKSEDDYDVLSNRSTTAFVYLKSSSSSTASASCSTAFSLEEKSEVLIDWFKIYSFALSFWKI